MRKAQTGKADSASSGSSMRGTNSRRLVGAVDGAVVDVGFRAISITNNYVRNSN